MRAANPRNHRGSINRADITSGDIPGTRRDRHPTPHSANDYPSAVVERSKTPGCVIHPPPAPRGNVCPVAVTIRSPADDGRVREPNPAVLPHRPPTAAIVEGFIANDGLG